MTTRLVFTFFLFVCFLSLKSQPGFIKSYDLNSWAYFTNIVRSDDTLVVTGLTSQFGQQAIHLTKFDTLGNMISKNVYRDSLGRSYVLGNIPTGFIKLKNNAGYLILGGVFETNNALIIKTDNNGGLLWVKEFEDISSRVDFFIDVIEVHNGYLIAGRKQKQNFGVDIFLMKIKHDGKKV